jgi:hypothetical protein
MPVGVPTFNGRRAASSVPRRQHSAGRGPTNNLASLYGIHASPPESLQVQPDLFQADAGLFPAGLAAQHQLVGVIVVQQVLVIAKPGYEHVELGGQPLNLAWVMGGQCLASLRFGSIGPYRPLVWGSLCPEDYGLYVLIGNSAGKRRPGAQAPYSAFANGEGMTLDDVAVTLGATA